MTVAGQYAAPVTISGQFDLAFNPWEPRGPDGRWVHTLNRDEADRKLEEWFHPDRLDAAQVRHPVSGYMLDAGEYRRVSQPEDSEHGNESLGNEGPATFDVFDAGNPVTGHQLFPVKVRTEPIQHVYRGVSEEEWQQARQRGYLHSDKRGVISSLEGTNAAVDPRTAVSYLPQTGRARILKIKVQPEDKWFTIRADGYVRTRGRIPLDRVTATSPVLEMVGRRGGRLSIPRQREPAEMAAGLITAQVDLAGEQHAWERELRDRRGRWARSSGAGDVTADAAGDADAVQRGGRLPPSVKDITGEWRQSRDDLVRKHLNLAAAHLDAGDHDAAAGELKQASTMAGMHGDTRAADRLFEMGQALSGESRTNAAVTGFAAKARDVVPGLLGGGREDWNGKISLFNAEDQPAWSAFLQWDGTMGLQRELALKIRDDQAGDGRISDAQPYVAVLHELIHGDVPAGGETPEWKALSPADQAALTVFDAMDKGNPTAGAYPTLHSLAGAAGRDPRITQDVIDSLAARGLLEKSGTTSSTWDPRTGESSAPVHEWMMTGKARGILPVAPQTHAMHAQAYRDPANAAVEEGFTELGTIHHAPEFFTAMGIGNRETIITAFEGGHVKVNPVYASVKATVFSKLTHQARMLDADPRAPYQQAAQAARRAAQELNDDNLPGAESELAALRHLGDPDVFQAAKSIQAGLDKMEVAGFAAKATMTEYAKRLRDPARIADGTAWGHYGWQAAAAQAWVQDAAKAEGKGPKSPRVRDLADEINREGVGGKVPMMARQVIRAAGGNPDDFQGQPLAALETRIRAQWAQGPAGAHSSPWASALAAVKDYMRSHPS